MGRGQGPLVIVQNNQAVDRLTGPVSRHARAAGYDLLDLDLRDGFRFEDVDIEPADRDAVLLHGSVGFLRLALQRDDLARRLSWSDEAFLASTWRDGMGDAYVGAAGMGATARDVSRMLARGSRLAVRPELGLKAFKGGVYDRSGWDDARVPDEVPCFAMPPSVLLSEHRVWFVDGEPVAASTYMVGGALRRGGDGEAERRAMDAAARLAARHLPLRDVVMDVAETPGGWRLVEFNCIHTSGWYGSDVPSILDALALRTAPAPSPGFR